VLELRILCGFVGAEMNSVEVLTVVILVAIVAGFIILTVSSSRLSHKGKKKIDSKPEEEAMRSFVKGELAVRRPDLFDAVREEGREMSPEEEAYESFAEGEYAAHLDDEEEKE
jgi:hypothetical protein